MSALRSTPAASMAPAVPTASATAIAEAKLSPTDLGQLLAAFNEVTARLSATHEALQAQVAGLKAELTEARGQVERSRRLAALGEMAAGIAHEVRNPLGSIMLYARMLQQDLAAMPPQQTIATKIASAVSRVEAIVTDVLSFSRETNLRPVEADAAELLEAAVEAARGDGPEWSGVTITGPEKTLAVLCDAGLIHQALVNVIRNAAEAVADSPTKVITLGVARRSVRQADGKRLAMAALTVRDTGPGIDPQVADRIFNPFVTTRPTGTGLGLAIVHRIVDAHGGRVTIANRPISENGGTPGAIVEMLLPIG